VVPQAGAVHEPVAEPLITGSTGGSPFSLTWTAPPEKPSNPALPPMPGCAAPQHHTDQKPSIHVDIEVSGSLDTFANQTGDIPLTGGEFTLLAGTDETKTFSFSPKTYDEIYGSGGFARLNQDQLYGAQIKVTVTQEAADATLTQDVYT